jgi:hypothetical protein
MPLVILTVALALVGALAMMFGADSRDIDRPARW